MRWVAGFLLVGAAILKAVDLVSGSSTALLNPLGRFFLSGQIGVEFAIGLVVLSGLYWRTLRWFVLVLFTGFAGYSAYLALNGALSCGCFGPVHVNPWWTMGLDSAVVLGVLVSALRECGQERNDPGAIQFANKAATCRQLVAVVMGIVIICTALLVRYAGQRTALANGLLPSVGDLVILEPEQWVGQRLPIAASVDLDLSQGEWLVLLHRHDCAACQEEVPRFEQRAANGERIALVEMPPYGESGYREVACQYGRLKEDHEWFVQTPIAIRLQAGIVTTIKTYDH